MNGVAVLNNNSSNINVDKITTFLNNNNKAGSNMPVQNNNNFSSLYHTNNANHSNTDRQILNMNTRVLNNVTNE